MDFLQLQYFVSVAQMLNFTKAANLHYISQPAISRRITELEKELGAQLFIRNSHKIELTSAGREFQKYAEQVLDMTSETTHRVKKISQGKTGRIRISAVPSADRSILRVIRSYTKRYPDVQIDLDYSNGKKQIIAIKEGKYDFYFSFERLLHSCDQLKYICTDIDHYRLFVPNDYADVVDVNDFSSLQELPLVTELSSEGPYLVGQMLVICRARGYDISNIIGCRDIRSVMTLANAGMGFTLAPQSLSRTVLTDYLVSFPLTGEDTLIHNAIGWDPNNSNSALQSFLAVIRETYSMATTYNDTV